ncbi:MAG: KpsF/GutQ family sugar-phosphate isomerase [Candidatus Kapabacteria bacterium]|jgi:arabinose-5-phosphate isomerase|nr:KpsF/GutQ family sugar-phosphate isomerase [Candidatus Kapabacteria bacterium]
MTKDTIKEEALRVFTESADAVKNLTNRINADFVDAVKVITDSKKVVVSGVGKSGIIAKKIVATFNSIGIKSVFLHPVEALHGDLGIVEEGDCAILLSKSGTTDEIVNIAPYLKQRSLTIISIVGNTKSYLAALSDYVLDGSVSKEACPHNLAPTTSTTVTLVIGDALAVCSMKYSNMTQKEFARNHPKGQLGKNLTVKVRDVMHKNSQLPLINLNESFKASLIKISEKGLGCVCVIDENSKFKGIITDGDVRRALQNCDDIRELSVKDVMTTDPISVSPEKFLGEALSIMENRRSQISVLPVLELEKCIGIIRIHDIIKSSV